MPATRRTFLGGMVVATASATAVASPLPAVTARARADFHYAELVKALTEATDGFDGWDLHATVRKSIAGREAVHHQRISIVRVEVVSSPAMVFERHEDFTAANT